MAVDFCHDFRPEVHESAADFYEGCTSREAGFRCVDILDVTVGDDGETTFADPYH